MSVVKKKRDPKAFLYEYDKKIAGAFKVDCEEFLQEFEKLRSFKFSDFAKVWQSRNFTFVFSGQKFAILLKELCENYFYIVKKYLILEGNVFSQIGALYLLYGLYYKQPLQVWVKIRLTLEEYKKITELIEDMKMKGEYEPVYIFARLKVDQAFLFTALPKPLGPEDRFVKSYERYLDYTFDYGKSEDTFLKFNEIVHDDDLVHNIEKTNDEYQALLKKYSVKYPQLTPFSSNIMNDLKEAYLEVQKEASTSKTDVVCVEPREESKEMKRKKQIRNKAVSNKNAVYRGNRNVKMGTDLDLAKQAVAEPSSDSDFHDDS